MRLSVPIQTSRLQLRSLTAADATERYTGWLNDPEVNRYLETKSATLESTRQFIEACNEGTDVLLGIFLADRHIGNIKLRERDRDIGVMIGELDCWGQGYATEAIRALTAYAFDEMGMERLIAGCYRENVGSARAFLKAGWEEQGRQNGKIQLAIKKEPSMPVAEQRIIDDIEKVRAANNTPWMDLIRLGLELDPERTKEILRRIHSYDRQIWELLDELAQS